ncbi:hypothetical protein MY1_0732 [Nitrosarchaeum koreense MY1]|uniref:Uncharacterized protein n=1 Tax=Nitrosarchaeum koreense MY1 TaxID=1001994 RepID=F9CW42_9ARCH|nr:hypothetical protein MY1_0732 [Nitrosarchaeum koreense MY1]
MKLRAPDKSLGKKRGTLNFQITESLSKKLGFKSIGTHIPSLDRNGRI